MTENQHNGANGPSLKKIYQVDSTTLGIIWTDGKESRFNVKTLREKCPCANCIDEWSGEKRIKPGQIKDTIRPVNIRSVGRYAIQISWNDGHDTGLYSHDYLQSLG
ncbi:MAG: hypothetical protein COV67_15160 [Nitrospinae bacterium CG11_big_fil_rev_8_21_14_0_20_56_8]|nr:MAG: hypothetical protein COV67_15160 [Nitrospinae bacterium CG11_big_fil_rev_8_21_14_0_20_56_8]